MTGDILKTESGALGISYGGNDRYVIRPALPNTPSGTYQQPIIETALDPIEKRIARSKESTLSIADALPRLSVLSGMSSGTDPEIFVFTKEGDVIPAWKFLPQKDEALLTDRNPDYEGYREDHCLPKVLAYWDGAQAEITISQGETCHEQLTDDVRAGLKLIYEAAQLYSPGATLQCRDVIKLDEKTLMEAEDVHVALGCAPSANAYKNVYPIDVGDPRKHLLRYSGAHLHFRVAHSKSTADGKTYYNQLSDSTAVPEWFPGGVIKMMDRVVGLLLTALGRDLEDPMRRKAYGRPGEYRVTTDAGLEYRTPGSFLLSRPAALNFALDMGRRAFGLGMIYNPDEFFLPGAKDIIMNCDADAAVEQIEKFKSFFMEMFRANNYNAEGTMEILRKGLKAHGLTGEIADMWKIKPGQEYQRHNNNGAVGWRSLSMQAAPKKAAALQTAPANPLLGRLGPQPGYINSGLRGFSGN